MDEQGDAMTTRPRIMGILNVTPDSFSDGGRHGTPEAAAEHALRMAGEGADVIDVGGESTRPGAKPVDAAEQVRRVVEVIRRVRRVLDGAGPHGSRVVVSIDTTLPAVAEAALDAGAAMVNDVMGGREPGMLELAARRGVPIALMHMQGTPATMQEKPTYSDVTGEVLAFLLERAAAALAAGVPRERIMIDPGIGFGKTKAHNLTLLADLPRFTASGYEVLLGTSRKRFMGAIANDATGVVPPPHELVGATCATTALGVAAGVRMFRVHDVQANRQAADTAFAILNPAAR